MRIWMIIIQSKKPCDILKIRKYTLRQIFKEEGMGLLELTRQQVYCSKENIKEIVERAKGN